MIGATAPATAAVVGIVVVPSHLGSTNAAGV